MSKNKSKSKSKSKSKYKSNKSIIKKVFRVVLGEGAAVASEGLGGDVIVDTAFAIQDSVSFVQQIHQYLKSADASKEMAIWKIFVDVDLNQKFPIKSKYHLNYNPRTHKIDARELMGDINAVYNLINEQYPQLLDSICQFCNDIANKLVNLLTDWLTAFIPEVGSIASLSINKTLTSAVDNGVPSLNKLFKMIPSRFQYYLVNEKALKELLFELFDFATNTLLHQKPKQKYKHINFLIKHIPSTTTGLIGLEATIIPGKINPIKYTVDFINKHVKPYVTVSTEVLNTSINLFFSMVAFLGKCNK